VAQAQTVVDCGWPARAEAGVATVRPALDLSHLRRFTLGNRELEREVLQLFAEQAPRTLRDMQLASSSKAWRDAAHTLKGSASAVGANAIARAAAEAEKLNGDPDTWPEMLERLRSAVLEARAFIAAST
jgi:HPt (histidine-containing phosphotransfer) domain-containing protein